MAFAFLAASLAIDVVRSVGILFTFEGWAAGTGGGGGGGGGGTGIRLLDGVGGSTIHTGGLSRCGEFTVTSSRSLSCN